MSRVAVLGMGAMGSRIAIRLVDSGHQATVWNRTESASHDVADGAPVHVAATSREAVSDAEVVLSMLTDDAASAAVWLDSHDGVLAAVPADAVVIESSTITRRHAIELGVAAATFGRAFVEAPVVGSRPQAETGQLLVLAAGADEALERARPFLEAFAGAVHPVGSIGNGATMKLAINGLFGVQVAAYAEVVGMLERSDVPNDVALEVLADLPITSPGLRRILGLVAARDFAPNFPIHLVAKDFAYLAALASELDTPAPVSSAAGRVFAEATADIGALDIAGIADRYL